MKLTPSSIELPSLLVTNDPSTRTITFSTTEPAGVELLRHVEVKLQVFDGVDGGFIGTGNANLLDGDVNHWLGGVVPDLRRPRPWRSSSMKAPTPCST